MATEPEFPSKEDLQRLKDAVDLQKEQLRTLRKIATIENEINSAKEEATRLAAARRRAEREGQVDEVLSLIDEKKIIEEKIARLESEKTATDSVVKATEKATAKLRAAIAKRKASNAELKEEIKLLEERERLARLRPTGGAEGSQEALRRKKQINDLVEERLQKEIQLAKKTGDDRQVLKLGKDLKKQQKSNKQLSETIKLLEEYSDGTLGANDSVKSFFSSLVGRDAKGAVKSLGGIQEKFSSLRSQGVGTTKAFKVLIGNVGKLAIGLTLGAAAIAGMVAVIGKLSKGMLDTATGLADAQNEAAKLTGGNKELTKSFSGTLAATREFGINSEELGKIFGNLTRTFTDFTMLSESSRDAIIKQTAALEKLGVDSSSTAKNLQLLTKAMGMTGLQAGDTTLELAALGKDLGMDPAQLAKDFGSAGSQLAKLGSDGVQAFKNLAVASKTTGLEIGKILSLIEKFDTFDGAATQAGKLNAALGGNFVNAMELMTATDPVERFSMIRDSILDAGLAFDDMSYYQRKFYTEAAGLSDVSDLAMMLSGDMSDLSGEVGKTSADYASAAERARNLAKFNEKLSIVMQKMIPIVDPLVDGLGKFADFLNENAALVRTLGIAIGIIGGVFVAFTGGPIMAVVGGLTALASAVLAVGSVLYDTPMNPPNFFQGIKEMSEDYDGLSINIDKTSKTMHSFGNEITSTGNKTYRQTKLTQKALPEIMQMTNSSIVNEVKKSEANNRVMNSAMAKTTAITNTSISKAQINKAMVGATTATTNAMSNAVKNSTSNNTTINNSGGGKSDIALNIKFDNKKFADLFDIQVENSIGRAARKAVV